MALEDFATYTEVDPNTRISAPATYRVTWAGLTENEDAYVYKDKGAAFFSGDFTHYVTIHISSVDDGVRGAMWALTNSLDDLTGIDAANGSYLALRLEYDSPTMGLKITEVDSGTYRESAAITISEDTNYYLKIVRNESVGTYGTIYLYVYTDDQRTALQSAAKSLALNSSKKDFQYVHAVITYDNNDNDAYSGYVENMELIASLEEAEVNTEIVTAIVSTTATGNGTITNLGISSVTQHGHCWATSLDPTTADSKTSNGAGSLGAFTSAITGLLNGQVYYTRAYVTNTEGTFYGANYRFTAGNAGSQLKPYEIKIKGTNLHYADHFGRERYITGVPL
jgi:hypothetical protein